jgi:MYXO-CTERM domain-containing protein
LNGITTPIGDRNAHTTTLLKDGRVVVAGGERYGDSDEDAVATVVRIGVSGNTATVDELPNLKVGRRDHAAVLLPDSDRVLVAGGVHNNVDVVTLPSAEVQDENGVWQTVMMTLGRRNFELVPLDTGWSLAAGGSLAGQDEPHDELFDPKTLKFSPVSLPLPHDPKRSALSATKLGDGSVLVAGGAVFPGAGNPYGTAERYRPLDLGAKCTVGGECRSGFCAAGVCCDQPCAGECQTCGTGVCKGRDGAACGKAGYLCVAKPDCPTSCDGKCADKYRCEASKCVPASVCVGNHVVNQVNASTETCDGFFNCRVIDGKAKCPTSCLSAVDCVDGYRCDQSARCVPDAPFAPVVSCAAGRGPGGSTWLVWLAVAAAFIGRRARR